MATKRCSLLLKKRRKAGLQRLSLGILKRPEQRQSAKWQNLKILMEKSSNWAILSLLTFFRKWNMLMWLVFPLEKDFREWLSAIITREANAHTDRAVWCAHRVQSVHHQPRAGFLKENVCQAEWVTKRLSSKTCWF